MARVTVEDCITKVPNRFELVMVASQRARAISGGAELTLERDDDKNPVIALREIAEETVKVDDLREAMIAGRQRHVEKDEPEEDNMALLMRRELESMAAGEIPAPPSPPAKPDVEAENAANAANADTAAEEG